MFLPPWFVCVETLVILTTSRVLESTLTLETPPILHFRKHFLCDDFVRVHVHPPFFYLFLGGCGFKDHTTRAPIVVGFIYLNLWWHSSQSPVSSLPKYLGIPSLYLDKHHPKSAALVSHVSSWSFSGIRSHKSKASLLARFVHQVAKYRDPLLLEEWICLFGDGIVCSELQGDKRCKWCFCLTVFFILYYIQQTWYDHDMQI